MEALISYLIGKIQFFKAGLISIAKVQTIYYGNQAYFVIFVLDIDLRSPGGGLNFIYKCEKLSFLA